MSKHDDVVARLAAIEERLARLEAQLGELAEIASLRAELRRKTQELDALARQSLHVVELLDAARRELAQREQDKGA